MWMLAYIDPGSGSLLLQAILAGLLSIPFFFRRTIGNAWQRLRGRAQPSDDRHDGSEPSER
jgi:hypothetical protein